MEEKREDGDEFFLGSSNGEEREMARESEEASKGLTNKESDGGNTEKEEGSVGSMATKRKGEFPIPPPKRRKIRHRS